MEEGETVGHASHGKPPGAGKSSFDLIDANKLFAALVLKPHLTVLDLGLLATVLHDLVEAGNEAGTLTETDRLVKPGGTLAIVEFKKIDGPPGPPRHIRLAPEEVEALVGPYGFQRHRVEELGSYTYLMLFKKV